MRKDLHEANRLSWNEATLAHNSHKADQARFLREGGSTLFPEEVELLGDLAGQRLLHLQCNSGQDTLSLARLGAIVTGVDISDTAIHFARELSAASGIPASFYRDDIYDWLPAAAARGEQFDLVFSSYGAMPWLSDLDTWAQGIAGILAPGGRFGLVEFHPVMWLFDENLELAYDYFGQGQPLSFDEGIGDYVGKAGEALAPSGYLPGIQDFHNPYPGHEFAWALSDIVTALLSAGLTLTVFREYPYINGDRVYPTMRPLPGNRWTVPDGVPELPLMYAMAAQQNRSAR